MVTVHEIGVILLMIIIIVIIITPVSISLFYSTGLFDHHGDTKPKTELNQEQEENPLSTSGKPKQ